MQFSKLRSIWAGSDWNATMIERALQTAIVLRKGFKAQTMLAASVLLLQHHSSLQSDVYNVLWIGVFAFATLNILSLAARRFEPNRRGLTFGELMAVLVVILSVFLLGWEMLNVFHFLPIKLER